MAEHLLMVHGNAFVPQQMGDDPQLPIFGPLRQLSDVLEAPEGRSENVITFSEVIGLHSGWGVTFRGKRDWRNWFHVPLPSIQTIYNTPATLDEVGVLLSVTESAVLEDIHVWSGSLQLEKFEHLALTGNFLRRLTQPRSLIGGVGLSVHVAFGASDSSVTFNSASAKYVTKDP